MAHVDIIRAWTDPEYRETLTAAERAQLPENPAGMVVLDDDALAAMSGGRPFPGPFPITTAPTCTMYTFINWAACGCP